MNEAKTLAKMTGPDTAQAMKRVNTSEVTSRLLSTAAGALTGYIAGKIWPTESMGGKYSPVSGAFVGGTVGYATARILEAISEFRADMSRAEDKDIKDYYQNTPISAYVTPGQSAYYQQQLHNKGVTEELMKSAAVLTPDDVKKYRQMAKEYKLEGRHILDEYDDDQITRLANGIGPSSFNDNVVKILNRTNSYAVPAAVIHDLEWSRGINSPDRFKKSNERFKANIDRVIKGMNWYNPLKYTAYLNSKLMKGLVDTNFNHYREGMATAKNNYLTMRARGIMEALKNNKDVLDSGSSMKSSERESLLRRILEANDRQAKHDSGYTGKSIAYA